MLPNKQRSEGWMMEMAEKLKRDVRILFGTCNDIVEKMNLIDAVHRLGIDHLFQEEIGSAISDIKGSEFTSSSLHEVALWFRLLREHGIWVSPDAFRRFKGEDGRFINTGIADEPRGLLSLYNAAHLLIHDEPELEEAISLARHHLELMRGGGGLKPPLADQINRALGLPLPRAYKRIETLHYMLEYGQEEGHNVDLLDLAKLEFNLLQHVHLKELRNFSQWWKNIYGYVHLSYARDHAVESYLWSYVVFYEKDLVLSRMIFAKIFALLVTMDDTYDDYATIEESRKLNEAIQRWDESAISLLPEYMTKFYNTLLNNFKEFEAQVDVSGQYRVLRIKKEFQKLSAFYLQEAEWSHQNYKPSFKEQVALSTLSSSMPLLCAITTVGQDDVVTREAFELATQHNSAVLACGKILRFMNDIAAFKSGRKNKGDATSTVECYMNEHKVTGEEAIARIDSIIEDEWKTLNEVRCEHPQVLPVVQRVMNLAISVPFFYNKRSDAYTSSKYLHKIVECLFVTPIPI
ncbi:tau-cadinol synthase-like isoform X2 [Oryza glaberrima]|uniref:tau-cadinol synthase-like isoform X2 n=1 Tax=Oryza glaberrima TaxID=4538 RepID=UPI00224C3113|nr:tau-cadinol synthase-like isoform X2 [Oryza glaberrima]